jgi:predicted nucleic acid-binding protein
MGEIAIKAKIVLDTMVFLKGLADLGHPNSLLEQIIKNCDRIVYCNKIKQEYVNIARSKGMPRHIFERKFKDLYKRKKFIKINEKEYEKVGRNLTKPKGFDRFDIKFLVCSCAGKVDLIITEDRGFMDFYKCGKGKGKRQIRIVNCNEYLRQE